MNPTNLDSLPKFGEFFTSSVDSAVNALVEEYNLQVDKLTKDQVAGVISQMIQSGDFIRYIVEMPQIKEESGKFFAGHRQGISYVPFREVERLKQRVKELEETLHKARSAFGEVFNLSEDEMEHFTT